MIIQMLWNVLPNYAIIVSATNNLRTFEKVIFDRIIGKVFGNNNGKVNSGGEGGAESKLQNVNH